MDTILKVLGFLFLGLLALLAVAGVAGKLAAWLLRRRLERLMGPVEKMKFQDVPVRLHLERDRASQRKEDAAVAELVAGVRALGFADVGAFVPREMASMRMQVLVHAGESSYAVVYGHARAGAWVDFLSSYEDGGTFTASSAARGGDGERRPGQVRIAAPGASASDLHERFLAERPGEGLVETTAQSFASCFEKAYADDMDWRNSRGGATDGEIRRMSAATGVKLTEESLMVIRARELEKAVSGLNVALEERLLADRRLSEADRKEAATKGVVFVFDLIPTDELGTFLARGAGEGDHGLVSRLAREAVPADLAGLTAREAFARLNEAALPQHRYRKLIELTEPVPADAWLSPRRPRKGKRR